MTVMVQEKGVRDRAGSSGRVPRSLFKLLSFFGGLAGLVLLHLPNIFFLSSCDRSDAIEATKRGNDFVVRAKQELESGDRGKAEELFRVAVTQFDSAIEVNPGHTDAYIGRGMAYEEQGRIDKAIADYLHALELKPKHINALMIVGNAFRRKGDFNAAVDYVERAQQYSKHPWIANILGKLLMEKGELEKAREQLELAVAGDRNDPEFGEDLAVVLLRLGKGTEARREAERVLSLIVGLESQRERDRRIRSQFGISSDTR